MRKDKQETGLVKNCEVSGEKLAYPYTLFILGSVGW